MIIIWRRWFYYKPYWAAQILYILPHPSCSLLGGTISWALWGQTYCAICPPPSLLPLGWNKNFGPRGPNLSCINNAGFSHETHENNANYITLNCIILVRISCHNNVIITHQCSGYWEFPCFPRAVDHRSRASSSTRKPSGLEILNSPCFWCNYLSVNSKAQTYLQSILHNIASKKSFKDSLLGVIVVYFQQCDTTSPRKFWYPTGMPGQWNTKVIFRKT